VACGQFNSAVPNGLGSLLLMAPFAPRIMKYAPQARSMQITCSMTPGCKIVDAQGTVIRELTQEHGIGGVVAEINLPDEKPQPLGPQPSAAASWLTYFSSDIIFARAHTRRLPAHPDTARRPSAARGLTPQSG
jgi:hypothetical protein